MRRSVTAVLIAVTVLVAAGACRGRDGGDDDLPDGAGLLAAAADEMAGVETVAMLLETDTDLGGLPVRQVDGVVTQAGDAEGTARVEQFGQELELRFVVVDEIFHYQLLGNWQQLPLADAAEFYDPSAILDPDRGVAQLLRTATDPRVERRDGDRYEVTATFGAASLAVLLPGTTADTRGTVWIGVDRPLLHQARFPAPAPQGGESGTVDVALSNFDEPVTVVAP
jgi:lipoprotein LprG